MDCPVCENAMITLELTDVEIDYCTDCGGIWLDAGELELLLDDPEKAKKLINSFNLQQNCTEKQRKCPICLKNMQKVLVSDSAQPLLIDRCTKGDGLWFDKGELKDIFDSANLDENSSIQRILAEMFGQENISEDK